MAKIYAQQSASVMNESGTLAGSDAGVGASTSGSLYFVGNNYARLVGTLLLGASIQAASGFQVFQSGDGGVNWDVRSACLAMAAGGSGFAYEIVGNAVKIKISNGSSANTYRSVWWVRPIQ